MVSDKKIKVLVIDDSAYNRKTLCDFMAEEPDIEVIARACDGEEGLQLALHLKPDVITLDLEMPRMDGFTFLRILMAKQPTPVIIISSHDDKNTVFKALELGALDFVAKPTKRISPLIKAIKGEVVKKVLLARSLVPESIHPFPPYGGSDMPAPVMVDDETKPIRTGPLEGIEEFPQELPKKIIAIAASTGGPATLTQILMAMPRDIDAGIVVVQHMPPRFTTTFADRLNRQCRLTVSEMKGVDLILRGHVYITPGDMCAEVSLADAGLCVVTKTPTLHDKYIPSANRLFQSLAAAAGGSAIGVVLTGMGDDGADGALEITNSGGLVIAEDHSTAIIPGMPSAVIDKGAANHVAPLEEIAKLLSDSV